jgi:hypothetical protein
MRYAVLALGGLMGDSPDRARYAWLCPDGASLYAYPHMASLQRLAPKLKTTLLAELGRISFAYGEDTMREVALQLCEEKPKTKAALQWLRPVAAPA